jgi:hypothetical protein
MRRQIWPLLGKRYCGNVIKKEVHDLDNEKPNCQIDEIIRAGHAKGFSPDTLYQAHTEGFDNCAYCIGGSRR